MAEQVYLSERHLSITDSFLVSIPEPSKVDLLPSLVEETITYVGQDVHHIIPGAGGVVTENGDAANVQLLQEDNLLIEAARTILPRNILGNSVTVQQYRWIVKELRDTLLQAGGAAPHKVSNGEHYARVLLSLAERLTILDSKSSHSFRRESYVECLEHLLENIEGGFVVMKQTGVEPDVFIVKDKEPVGFSERLSSLASLLLGDC